jgi:hypothetical protein
MISDLWEHVSFDLDYRVRGDATFLFSAIKHSRIDVVEYVLSRVNPLVVRGLVSMGDCLWATVHLYRLSIMKGFWTS